MVGSGGGISASPPAQGGAEVPVPDLGEGGPPANRACGVKDLENDSIQSRLPVGNGLGNDPNDLGCMERAQPNPVAATTTGETVGCYQASGARVSIF